MTAMRKKLLIVSALLFANFSLINAQPGCPNINAGSDQNLNCTTPCANLAASVLQTGATTSYGVSTIPYSPPYGFTGGTQLFIGTDDIWGGVVSLPFNFCFFGNTYNQIVVGANGLITFDVSQAGGFCEWAYTASCPTPGPPPGGLYNNSIMGAYHDIDPSVGSGNDINYAVLGSYPCRTFVVNYFNVPHYQCNSIVTTQQIVLYETTNVIEVYIQDKPTCASWNSGNAVIGIQNATGTVGFTPPARNTGPWSTSNEAWRFTPNGAPNYNVTWFDGATTVGTGLAISVCPTATTTYSAQAVYNNCDGSTVTVTDDVNVNVTPPGGSISVSPAAPTICSGQSVNLTASGGVSYTWSPATGLSATTGATVTANPTTTTTYTIQGVLGNGCVAGTTVTVTVGGPTVTVNSPTICQGDTATLNASGATSYTWTPATNLSATTGTTVNANPGSTITYSVIGQDGSGCADTAQATVTVVSAPVADAGADMLLSCTSTSVILDGSLSTGGATYNWSGPGVVSGGTTTSPTIDQIGTYIITVTTGSCSSTDTVDVTQDTNSPTADAGGDDTLNCVNTSLTLNANGSTGSNLSFSWSGPGIVSGGNTATPTVNQSGTYTVTVTNTANGCTDTDDLVIILDNTPPVTDAGLGGVLDCNTSQLTLNGSPTGIGYTYNWTTTNGNIVSGNTTASPIVNDAGTYYLTVTGINGCSASDSVTITSLPGPLLHFPQLLHREFIP